jgi:Arc/MetJ-type ribon-helix-helix transcriptional regulator
MATKTKTRGAANRSNCQVVTITIPTNWDGPIRQAIAMEDSDRSKLCRAALRDWLEKRGFKVPRLPAA